MLGLVSAWIVSTSAAEPRQPQPLPTAEDMARSMARVQQIFADDVDGARTSAEKAALARRLADEAAATTQPSDRFALLSLALDKGIEAGDVVAASGLIDRIPREFTLPTEEWKLAAATRLAARAGPSAAGEIAEIYLVIGRDAFESDDEGVVAKASALALAAARRARDADRAAQATRLQQKLRQRQSLEKEIRPLLDAVAANPADADANESAGKAVCLKADRWAEGLPLLARGGDQTLRKIAVDEMKMSDSPTERVALADAWWDWSETQKTPWKSSGRSRAIHHYERAANSLTGLEKARVENRLVAAARASGGSGQSVLLADLAEKAVSGQVMFSKDGRCFGQPFTVGGKGWPKAITALPKVKSTASVSYAVPPGAVRCRGRVGVFTPASAKPGEKPGSPLVFGLVVDGDVAWRSPPLRNLDDSAAFDVDVAGARLVELQTAVGDSDWCCWGTWLHPEFVK